MYYFGRGGGIFRVLWRYLLHEKKTVWWFLTLQTRPKPPHLPRSHFKSSVCENVQILCPCCLPHPPPPPAVSPFLALSLPRIPNSWNWLSEVSHVEESFPHLAYITKQIRDIEAKCVNPVIIMVIMRQFNDLANCLFSKTGLENIPYPIHPFNSA